MTPQSAAHLTAVGLAIALIASPPAGAAEPSSLDAPQGVTRDGDVPLRSLLARATAVVAGRPGGTVGLDEGRLAVHPVRVDEVLRGTLDLDVAPVVEIRGITERPTLFAGAERVVVLLQPAKALSYYATHLPDGPHFEAVAGRDGVIPIRSEADLDVTRALLEQGVAASAAAPGDEQQAALRALAFAALDARHPRWLADALLELRVLPGGTTLTTEEVSALSGTLRDTAMPAPLRVRLLRLLAERQWVGATDVVAVTEVDEPSVLDALLAARARLGIPPTHDELARHLESKNPRIRAAAVRALAATADPKAVPELGRYATRDPDQQVQEAALDALATTGRAAAVPYMKEAFDAGKPAIRQASARALLKLGGRQKSDALLDLALTGETPDARHYAAIILVISTPPDDPAIARLRAEATDQSIRRLLEHGIELKAHRHDD